MEKKESEPIAWHPGFYSGIELELMRYQDVLTYEPEHQLSKEPLRMDLLIIKMSRAVEIEDEIGRIFRRYNVVEYKSPDDALTIDDFYKTLGYAFLYKGLGKTVNEIPAEELTVSLFRAVYPRELFKDLRDEGVEIAEVYPGIYYVKGIVNIPVQVVVTDQLSEAHTILRVLSKNAHETDAREFLTHIREWTDPNARNNASSVLHVSMSANKAMYDEIGKEREMSDVFRDFLNEIFKDEISDAKATAEEFGVRKTLYSLAHDGIISTQTGAARANMSEADFTENMQKMYS